MLTRKEKKEVKRIAANLKQFEADILEEYNIYNNIMSKFHHVMVDALGLMIVCDISQHKIY